MNFVTRLIDLFNSFLLDFLYHWSQVKLGSILKSNKSPQGNKASK